MNYLALAQARHNALAVLSWLGTIANTPTNNTNSRTDDAISPHIDTFRNWQLSIMQSSSPERVRYVKTNHVKGLRLLHCAIHELG